MKKRNIIANMMMEICMQACCMRMVCRVFLSNMFSNSGVNRCAV